MSISADKFLNMIDVGYNVDIQRTDGRIHSALISQVNPDTFTVTVEWIEKGETKGKELDIHTLVQLNPELKNLKMKYLSQEKDDQMVVDDEEEEVGGDDDVGGDDNDEEYDDDDDDESEGRRVSEMTAATQAKSRRSLPVQQSIQQHKQKQQQQLKQQLKQPAKTAELTGRQSGIKQPTFSKLSATQSTARNSLTRASSKESTHPPKAPSNGRLSSGHMPTSFSAISSTKPSRAYPSTNSNKKKKLSCVKEVEMIKQRREERRANQVLQKEAFENHYDTSTLNWEFAHMIKEFKSSIDLAPVTSYSEPSSPPKICVCVRKRPLNHKEQGSKEIDVITIPGEDVLLVHEPKTKVDLTRYLENHKFRFDYAFDDSADNEMVYRFTAKPLVESIFDRGMATCFAYGQTGSGKTHTMGGEFLGKGQQDCTKGIYALAAQDVFRLLHTTYKRLDLVVYASFFEIYAGKIFDLLNNKSKLRVLADSKARVQVCGLKEELVGGVDEVLGLLERGSFERTSGVTSANNQSSRSHAIFQIVLKKRSSKLLHGKFSLIDLAGNERGKDTMCSERQTRMEGAEINKSLLALKECIRALGVKGSHLPFRVSQLTQVLKDSFTGKNSRTCMIAMISPGMNSCEHTLNTLRYADRVKELRVNDGLKNRAPKSQTERTRQEVPRQNTHKRIEKEEYEEEEEEERYDDDINNNAGNDGDDVVTASDDNTNYDDDDEYENGGDDDDDVQQESMLDERELAMLRSNNGDEVSEDVLNYDRALFNLHQKEEEVITAYQQVIKEQHDWIELDKVLLRMTEKPDYDVEVFSNGVKEFIDKKIDRLNAFKEMVDGFVDVIQYEESLGQNFTQK